MSTQDPTTQTPFTASTTAQIVGLVLREETHQTRTTVLTGWGFKQIGEALPQIPDDNGQFSNPALRDYKYYQFQLPEGWTATPADEDLTQLTHEIYDADGKKRLHTDTDKIPQRCSEEDGKLILNTGFMYPYFDQRFEVTRATKPYQITDNKTGTTIEASETLKFPRDLRILNEALCTLAGIEYGPRDSHIDTHILAGLWDADIILDETTMALIDRAITEKNLDLLKPAAAPVGEELVNTGNNQ